jgi:two-component system LytT family sensor kinase
MTLAGILGCWTVAGLVYSSHLYVFHTLRGETTAWTFQLAEALADFYMWALLTPVVLALGRQFPLATRAWPRALAVHLPASLLCSLVQVALHAIVDQTLIHGNWSGAAIAGGFVTLFGRTFHFGLLVYWTIVGVREAIARYQDQKLSAARLEAQLAHAKLQALEMQLHPHFLFNTLNAISALVRRDPAAAERMISRLGEMLRATLALEGAQEVPLADELAFLERYLEIEQVRFGDRLTVDVRVDPAVRDARVPTLILQPLVENSIRHGIANRRGAGVVEVSASRENGSLRLAVRDNGTGLDGDAGEGVGLANTRARLEVLYGGAHRFELRPRPEGGVEAAITIPLRSGDVS